MSRCDKKMADEDDGTLSTGIAHRLPGLSLPLRIDLPTYLVNKRLMEVAFSGINVIARVNDRRKNV